MQKIKPFVTVRSVLKRKSMLLTKMLLFDVQADPKLLAKIRLHLDITNKFLAQCQ